MLFTFILFFLVLISAIDYFAFNKDIYRHIQIKHHISAYNDMAQDSLDDITSKIIDYLKSNDLEMKIYDTYGKNNENNENTKKELFNFREKEHMRDVQILFRKMEKANVILIVLLFLLLLLPMLLDFKTFKKSFSSFAFGTFLLILAFLLLVLAYIFIDFYSFWNLFHELIFTNDLYIMYPETDLLINIMPLEFFVSLCIYVAAYTGLLFLAFFVIIFGVKKNKRIKRWKNDNKEAQY